MKKLQLHFNRRAIGELIARQSLRIMLLLTLVVVVLFALFIKTSLIDTLYFPRDISESEITARQQKVNTKLFDQILEAFQSKGTLVAPDTSKLRNPFSSFSL